MILAPASGRPLIVSIEMNASTASAPAPCFPAASARLADRIAIVTGASSGLGRAVALYYAAEGAKVACADLNPIAQRPMKEEDVKATHEIIGERDGEAIFVPSDVSDSQSVQSLVAKTVEQYGRLDM